MGILSMTGYGKGIAYFENQKIKVEIKSVNGKQAEIKLKLPYYYYEKEIKIRTLLQNELQRGSIELLLTVESNNVINNSSFNPQIIENYYKLIKQTCTEYNIPEPADYLSVIIRIPEVLKSERIELDEKEWDAAEKAINEALNNIIECRKSEGAALEKDIMQRIALIKEKLSEISKYEAERIENTKKKILESFESLNIKDKIDPLRLEQEMVYYLEKLDITEEKTRLSQHLDYLTQTINEENAQGKKIGFILQEIGREINTIGSKSNHFAIQQLVVVMKDELEKIREQSMNIL